MAAGPTVKKIMQTDKGRVRLVIKNYPYRCWDYARIAAEASLAARDQDKYWEMHDLLIKRSPKLDRASIIQDAKELGLDVKKFTESIDSQKHARDIDRDLELAVTMDLYTTPTFYIFTGEKWLVSGRSIISGRLLMRS